MSIVSVIFYTYCKLIKCSKFVHTTVSSRQRILILKRLLSIISYLNLKKAFAKDKITFKMLKKLLRKRIALTHHIQIQCHPKNKPHKGAGITLIANSGKDHKKLLHIAPYAYCLASRKAATPKTEHQIEHRKTILFHQLDFLISHDTVQQMHRIRHEMKKTLVGKTYSTSIFLKKRRVFNLVSGILDYFLKSDSIFPSLILSY